MTRRSALLITAGVTAALAAVWFGLYLWNPAWAVIAGITLGYVLLLGPPDEYDPAYPLVQRWRALRGVFRRRRRRPRR